MSGERLVSISLTEDELGVLEEVFMMDLPSVSGEFDNHVSCISDKIVSARGILKERKLWKEKMGLDIKDEEEGVSLKDLKNIVKEMLDKSVPYLTSYGGFMVPGATWVKLADAVSPLQKAITEKLNKISEKEGNSEDHGS